MTSEYLTIAAAARRLGLTEAAVRQRIRRGTLPSEKLNGRLHVVLSTDVTPVETMAMQRVETHPIQQAMQHVASRMDAQSEEFALLRTEIERLVRLLDTPPRRRWWRFWR